MNELCFWIGFGVVMTAIACVLFYRWLELDRMCDMYARRLNDEIKLKDFYKEQLTKMTAKVDAVLKALRGEE